MIDDDDIPDSELLNLPASAILPLSRLWALRSGLIYQKQMTELAAERNGLARPVMLFDDPHRKEHKDFDRMLEEIRERSDRLLVSIEDYQNEIDNRRRENEKKALHMHDGRHVYVDGQHFRDEYGNILHGSDLTEARALYREHPDASTWASHEQIREQAEEAEKLKQKVLDERAGASDPQRANDRLTDYEQDLHQQMEQRHTEMAAHPVDYGDASLSELTATSIVAFNAAAAGENETPAPVARDTETETADNKQTPRPSTPGAFKL